VQVVTLRETKKKTKLATFRCQQRSPYQIFILNKLDCLASHLATFVNGHQFTYFTKLESKNTINDILQINFT
jgi:hypothetical protein